MTTTDANGIQFIQDTDNIAPFQTLINGLQTATSAALNSTARIFRAADATDRASKVAALAPTTSAPALILQTDTGVIWKHDGSTAVQMAAPLDDTGWLTMTLDSGATVSNSYTPKYRRYQGVVYLQGQVTQASSTIWTIPAGFRRSTGSNAPRYAVMTGNSGATAGVVIYSGNQIYTAAGATVNLDGISWRAEA